MSTKALSNAVNIRSCSSKSAGGGPGGGSHFAQARHPQLIETDGRRLRKVQCGIARIGRDADEVLAKPDLLVGQTARLGTENQCDLSLAQKRRNPARADWRVHGMRTDQFAAAGDVPIAATQPAKAAGKPATTLSAVQNLFAVSRTLPGFAIGWIGDRIDQHQSLAPMFRITRDGAQVAGIMRPNQHDHTVFESSDGFHVRCSEAVLSDQSD